MLKRLVRYKIYIDRARTYVGYVQFLMLAIIMAKQFGVKLGFGGSVMLVVLFFLGCLFVGYVDTHIGIRREENANTNEQNPQVMEILSILRHECKDGSGHPCSREKAACEVDSTEASEG